MKACGTATLLDPCILKRVKGTYFISYLRNYISSQLSRSIRINTIYSCLNSKCHRYNIVKLAVNLQNDLQHLLNGIIDKLTPRKRNIYYLIILENDLCRC